MRGGRGGVIGGFGTTVNVQTIYLNKSCSAKKEEMTQETDE